MGMPPPSPTTIFYILNGLNLNWTFFGEESRPRETGHWRYRAMAVENIRAGASTGKTFTENYLFIPMDEKPVDGFFLRSPRPPLPTFYPSPVIYVHHKIFCVCK